MFNLNICEKNQYVWAPSGRIIIIIIFFCYVVYLFGSSFDASMFMGAIGTMIPHHHHHGVIVMMMMICVVFMSSVCVWIMTLDMIHKYTMHTFLAIFNLKKKKCIFQMPLAIAIVQWALANDGHILALEFCVRYSSWL